MAQKAADATWREAVLIDETAATELKKKLEEAVARGEDLNEEDLKAIEEQLGDKVLSSIKEVDDEEQKFEAMGPGMMDILWDRIDSVRHLVVATFLAYLLGYLGFHLFWVAILFYFVYSLDASYKLRGFHHFYKVKKLKVKEHRQDSTSEESAKWFNFLMLAVWPNISNRIAVETKHFMSAFIEQQLTMMKPPNIHGVYVRSVSVGVIPPQIKLLKPHKFRKTDPNRYTLDITLHYAGELEITIVAIVGTEGIKAKMPITIKDIHVTAEIQVDLLFFPIGPYIKEMDIAFRHLQHDWLGFNIKALGAFNVLSLPVLKEWVLGAITSGVKDAMLLPKTVHVNLGGTDDEDDAKAQEAAAKKKEERKVVPLKQGERNPFVMYKGHVKVTLVEARNLLKTDRIGTTDAYAKISLNDVWYKTPAISNSLDPVWNLTYELPLEANNPDQSLKIKVKDWDATGKNDLQGTAEIFVTKLEPAKRLDVWADLMHPTSPQRGQVHVLVEYLPQVDSLAQKRDQKLRDSDMAPVPVPAPATPPKDKGELK